MIVNIIFNISALTNKPAILLGLGRLDADFNGR